MHSLRIFLGVAALLVTSAPLLVGAGALAIYPRKAAEYAVAFATQDPAPQLDDAAAQDAFIRNTPFARNTKFLALYREAIGIVQTLKQDQTAIAPGDNSDVVDVIVDSLGSSAVGRNRVPGSKATNVAGNNKGSDATPETKVTAAPAEVLPDDKAAYELLKAKEVVLMSDLDAAKKKAGDAATPAKEKSAAEKKASDVTLELKANQAAQQALRAKAAQSQAEEVAAKATTNDAKQVAAAKVSMAKKEAAVAQDGADALAKELKLQTDTASGNFRNIQGFFHTGFSLLNPYKIDEVDTDKPTHRLVIKNATSTDVAAIFEFRYSNRWAWNAERATADFPDLTQQGTSNIFSADFKKHADVDVRLGYTFAGSEKASASTLVGTGDFHGELSTSMPFWLYRSPNDAVRFTVGPVLSLSSVTDRAFLKPHNRLMAGASYSTAFDDPFSTADADHIVRKVLLDFRIGAARIDSVHYAVDDTGHLYTDGKIEATESFQPKFYPETAWAFESQLLYPINTSSFLIFDGRVYSNVKPGQWNLQIGFTTSLQGFIDSFTK
jgi:hypothetical protein